MNRLPPLLLLPLLLPGAVAALLLPSLPCGLLGRAEPPLWRIALAAPVILLPLLLALTRLQRHQARAAAGLGAGWLDRLRWLWLPQLGPSLLASLLLAVLFVLAAGFGWHRLS